MIKQRVKTPYELAGVLPPSSIEYELDKFIKQDSRQALVSESIERLRKLRDEVRATARFYCLRPDIGGVQSIQRLKLVSAKIERMLSARLARSKA